MSWLLSAARRSCTTPTSHRVVQRAGYVVSGLLRSYGVWQAAFNGFAGVSIFFERAHCTRDPKPYAQNRILPIVEARKLEHDYPHALKIKYRESQH